jgi:hypothetical protein
MVKKLPCRTVTIWGQTGNAPNGITMAFNTLILGKGTGTALAMGLIKAGLKIYLKMATFQGAQV